MHVLSPPVHKENVTGLNHQICLNIQEPIPQALSTTDLNHVNLVTLSEVRLGNRAVCQLGLPWNGQLVDFFLGLVPH